MRVSIVLPCRNEARYIGPCLDSILTTTYPVDSLEILVVDGMSDDETREIVDRYASSHPEIRRVDNPARIVPAALNLGIRAATGDIVMRMDAHVRYPPDYVPRLVAALRTSGADNVGGCVVTVPADGSHVARGIALAMAHPIGVGNSYFRIGSAEPRWVETVPFGCFRRSVFEQFGLFDEELVRNQDDEFNYRLVRGGGRILLLPCVEAYYYARRSYSQLLRMFHQYGYFKPLVARKLGRIMTVRQLVPSLFVVALVLAAAIAVIRPGASFGLGTLAGTYAVIVLGSALGRARTAGLGPALAMALAFPAMHLGYGSGFLQGLWRHWVARRAGTQAAPVTVPLSR